ncbi:MAG TPA: hypothetical protein VIT24_00855 [Acidimicrobiales bacterium]
MPSAAGGRLTVHDAREHIRRLFTITGLAAYLAERTGLLLISEEE